MPEKSAMMPWAALGLAVTAHGGQILHRVGVQKFYDFVHDKYLQMVFDAERLLFSFVGIIITP